MPVPAARVLARAARHVPGLKRIPILRILTLAEIAVLARDHVGKLTPVERRRLIELLRIARGRPGNLSPLQREELGDIVAKAEPRLLMGRAVERFSPVSIPSRLLYGPHRRRAIKR